MSVAFKIASLGIRTVAKPFGVCCFVNWIKGQAREHEGFRKLCVSFAQRLHRIDMRMRLGLLQDPAVIERQIKREQDEAERKKNPEQTATVKTKEETDAEAKEREEIRKKLKRGRPIKPLSEAKAIDSGATFLSEGFLFLVAGGLIIFEQWRGKRKDTARRDEVRERLDALESQLQHLQAEDQDVNIGLDSSQAKEMDKDRPDGTAAATQASGSSRSSSKSIRAQVDARTNHVQAAGAPSQPEIAKTTQNIDPTQRSSHSR